MDGLKAGGLSPTGILSCRVCGDYERCVTVGTAGIGKGRATLFNHSKITFCPKGYVKNLILFFY